MSLDCSLFLKLLMRTNIFLVLFQFVSDYSGQPNFLQRVGPDGLHSAEKEATVSNILQTIRSCHRSLESEETADSDPASTSDSPGSRRNSVKYKNPYVP